MSVSQARDQALTALYEQVVTHFSLGAQAAQVHRSPMIPLNHIFTARPLMLPSPVQQLSWPMLPFGPQCPTPNPPESLACAARPTWVAPVAQHQPLIEQGSLLYGNPLAPFFNGTQGLLSACLMAGPDPVSLIKTLAGILQALAYMPAQQGAQLADSAFADAGGSVPYGALAALAQATTGCTSLGGPPAHGVVNPAAQLPQCIISGGSPPQFKPVTPALPRPVGSAFLGKSSSPGVREPVAAPNVSHCARVIAVNDVTAHSGSKGGGQALGNSRSILFHLSGSQPKPQGTRQHLATAGEMPQQCNKGRMCTVEETGLQLEPGGSVTSMQLKLPRPQQQNWPAAVARLLLPVLIARLEVTTCGRRPTSRSVVQGRMVLSMLMAGQSNLHNFLDSMAKASSHLEPPKLPTSGPPGLARGVPKRRQYPLVRALSYKRAQMQALDHQPWVTLKGQGNGTSTPMSLPVRLPDVEEEPLGCPAGKVAGSPCPDTTVLHCGLIPLPVPRAPDTAQPRHRRHLSPGKASAEHAQPVTGHTENGSWQAPGIAKRQDEVRGTCAKVVTGLWRNRAGEENLFITQPWPPLNGIAAQNDVPLRSWSRDMSSAAVMQPQFMKRQYDQRDSPPSKRQRLCDGGPSSAHPGARPSALVADHGALYPIYSRLVAAGPIVDDPSTCGSLKPVASCNYLREPDSAQSTSSPTQLTTPQAGSQEGGSPKVYLSTLRTHGPGKAPNGVKKALGKGLSHRTHLKSCKSQNIVLLATAAVMVEKGHDMKASVPSPTAATGSSLQRSNSGSAMHWAADRLGQGRRKYLGVGYKPKTRRWYAQLRNGKEYYWLGCNFTNPEDAARAYDRVARALRGPSTQPVNFPLEPSDAIADMQMQLSDTSSSGGVKLIGCHGKQKHRGMSQPYMGSEDQGGVKQLSVGKARPLDVSEPQDQDLNGDRGLSMVSDHEPSHSFTAAQQRRGTSRYRGVCRFNAKTGVARWKAQIVNAGQVKHLGYFATELDAARAFDRSAINLRGPLADVNFPQEL